MIDSLAVILPRYGKSLGGGAETLTQALLHSIVRAGNIVRHVEVWTTCAKDHRTWSNEHPAGTTVEEGITVRRFLVDPRDVDIFLQAEFAMRDGHRLSLEQQLDWLANSVNSAELYRHIQRHGERYSMLLFAPYLFATSFWGSLIFPEKSVLIPCLHDEHYAYQQVFHGLFSRVRGLIYNAAAEGELVERLYGPQIASKGTVVGMGFDDPGLKSRRVEAQASVQVNFSLEKPYLLYSGRKEQGKNLDLLIDMFAKARSQGRLNDLELVMIGAGEINFLSELPPGVRDLGFVSEQDKATLMRGALALAQPSMNESFSIVMMEAFLRETPALVHAHCPVTRAHVVESGAGLFFSNLPEFIATLEYLRDNSVAREMMGRSARQYVLERYNWAAVNDRFCRAVLHMGIAQFDELTAQQA